MAAIKLKIHNRAFGEQLRRATAAGLQRAAVYYHSHCRHAVNVSNTDRHVVRYRDASGRRRSRTVYENMHNLHAGKPPRKRTGFGQSQILWEYNGNPHDPAVRVGVTKAGIYMIYLELGTRRIMARPWLVATLMQHLRAIGLLAATGGRGVQP